MSPFTIHWKSTGRLHNLACYQSRAHPGHGYVFVLRNSWQDSGYDLYYCSLCKKIYDQLRKDNRETPGQLKSIRVSFSDGCFLSDPDELPHVCMESGPRNDTLWTKISERRCKKWDFWNSTNF